MITDLQGAGRDRGRTGEVDAVARDHHRAGTGVRQRARAVDHVAEVVAARAVDDQGRVVDDRGPERLKGDTVIVGAQRARGTASADLQGSRRDGDRAGVDVGAREHHGAGTLLGVAGRKLVRVGEAARHRQDHRGVHGEVPVGAVGIDVDGRDRGVSRHDDVTGEIEGAEVGVSRASASDRATVQGQQADGGVINVAIDERGAVQRQSRGDRRSHAAITEADTIVDRGLQLGAREQDDLVGAGKGAVGAGDEGASVDARLARVGVRDPQGGRAAAGMAEFAGAVDGVGEIKRLGRRMVEVEEGPGVDGDRRAAERARAAHAIAKIHSAGEHMEKRAELQGSAVARERGHARAELEDLTVTGQFIAQRDIISPVDLEDTQSRNGVVRDRDRARTRQAAGAQFEDAVVHVDAAGEQVGAGEGHLARAILGQLQLAAGNSRAVAVVDQDTAESEVAGVADREARHQVLRIRHEARARDLRDDQIEIGEVEARAGADRDRAGRRDGRADAEDQEAAGDGDLLAVEVIIRPGELERTRTGLGEGGAADGRERRSEVTREFGGDGRTRDGDRTAKRAEIDVAGEPEVRRRHVATEGEISVHRDGVGDRARQAIAEQIAAVDDERAGTHGAAGRGTADRRQRIRAEHQPAGVEQEVRREVVLTRKGQEAVASLGQGSHRARLTDDRADDQAGLRETAIDRDDRADGAEAQLGVAGVTRADRRRGGQAVVRGRERVRAGELGDAQRLVRAGNRGRIAQVEGRGVGAAFVDEGQAGERLGDRDGGDGVAQGIVRQGQVAPAVDGDGRGRVDLLDHAGAHVHRRVADGQPARGGNRVPAFKGAERLAGGGRAVGARGVERDGEARRHRENLRADREVAVHDDHAGDET